MPLYEYQCLNCDKTHEVMQRFSDPPLTECPNCKGKLKKLVSLSSFSLKGTGWYTTDYKRKNSSQNLDKPNPDSEGDKKKGPTGEGSAQTQGGNNETPCNATVSHQKTASATTTPTSVSTQTSHSSSNSN